MDIAVDFDGTCVTHEYPQIGKEIGSILVLKKLVEHGHKLILYTMRSGSQLSDAEKWFLCNGISLYGVQFNPEQAKWTASNKCYAQLYIDDASLGCPLIYPDEGRPYVDWKEVERQLRVKNIIK